MLIDARTQLYAVLGYPVEHSLSPVMHNAALVCRGINAVYLALSPTPAQLPAAVRGLVSLNCRGWNVTAPHKLACASLADVLVGPAQALRAVNTMVWEDQRLTGYNTDVSGLAQAWEEHRVQGDQHLLLLGAGGVALATAWTACSLGLSLTIASRSTPDVLATMLNTYFPDCSWDWCPWTEREEQLPRADLVVNATPLNAAPHWPVDPEQLQPQHLVCDLTYARGLTPWLAAAAKTGARLMDGRELLLYQGAEAFQLFTHCDAPLEVMRQALYGGA